MSKKGFLLCALLLHASLYGTTSTWIAPAGDGNWSDTGNWDNSTPPNAAGDEADFPLPSAVDPAIVTVDVPITVGIINITAAGDPFGFQFVGASTLTLQTLVGNALITGAVGVGVSPIFTVPIALNSPATFDGQNIDNNGGIIFDNAISGGAANGVTITGPFGVAYTGSLANTYTGLTTVTNGSQLFLNKSANVTAIAGDITVASNGFLVASNTNQFASTSTLTLSGPGAGYSGVFAQTLGTLVLNSGSFWNSSATLTLASAVNALTMQNTGLFSPLSSPIILTGGGSVVFDPSNNGTATISGPINLGGSLITFNIGNGAAAVDMQVTNVISNGGINKTGLGLLLLTGANTYAGGTTVTAGTLQGNTTSLQGNIVNNSSLIFNQTFDGSYTGALSGIGTLTKIGDGVLSLEGINVVPGAVTVSDGELEVNGSLLGGGPLTVAPGAVLGGAGTIAKNSTIFGTLSPGNEIGILTLIGDQVLATGSLLEIERDALTHDLVNIQGTLTIQPGSTLFVAPIPGEFLVHTTAGVFGTFSSVISSSLLFRPVVIYTQFDILLQANFLPFSAVFNRGKAGAVAHCLDVLPAPQGSDLAVVIDELHDIPTLEELKAALITLQPSAFTSLSVEQENNTLLISHAIGDRLETQLFPCGEGSWEQYAFWAAPVGGFTHQVSHEDNPGYYAHTPGLIVGVDFSNRASCCGSYLAYSHTDLQWKERRGNSQMDSAYGGLYAQWQREHFYFQGSLTGAYNWYKIKRNIAFHTLDRHAKSHHHGVEGAGNLRGGLLFASEGVNISPYLNLDYIYLHEGSFRERGAGSINLCVRSKNASILVSEWGVDIYNCGSQFYRWMPFANASVIHEARFSGGRERASFEEGCLMSVRGSSPSRVLGGLTVGATYTGAESSSFITLYYRGKYGARIQTHAISLDAAF